MDSRSLVHDEVVVTLSDATFVDGLADLRWQLHDLVLAGARVIVVDVAAVSRMSSTAIAAMLGAHRACRARGGGVMIRNPNRRTLDVLNRTGLHRILRVAAEQTAEPERGVDHTGQPGQPGQENARREKNGPP